MCGIAGFFGRSPSDPSSRLLLQRMNAALAHRGPDAQGVMLDGPAGLAHARLSIIDLAGGQQPMTNADGTVALTFNGEIFNYVELRRDLIARGRVFRTQSDTEVILHLYEERGADCVQALNGDFAFAIWDSQKNQLLLARDRMGVRPLFYAVRQGCLYFASEIKALLEASGVTAALDPVALDQIFTLWSPLAPRTIFKDVQELPPGHVMIATPGQQVVRRYWELQFPEIDDRTSVDPRAEAAIAEELRTLLLDATRIRLRSDVPVGAYLSGGLDSSIVTAAIHQLMPERLRTFSVRFEADEFDEGVFQQEMVRALGTEHSSILCSAAEIGQSFPDVIRHAERPILRTAPAPLFALSRLVNEAGFKVVLTGEGADEVFGGYDIFKEAKLRRFCAQQPQSRLRPLLFQRLYPYLPRMRGQSQAYREAFFAAGTNDLADPLFSHLPRFRTTAGAKIFFSAPMRDALRGYDALADLRDSLPEAFGRWHPLSQAQYLETTHLLPGYILSAQGDRVAMAHAVEGRFPFLDHRLVEFAARIPPQLKLRALREKHILRESTRDLVPASIAQRPKQPYRAPDSQSFTGANMPGYFRDITAASAIADAGYFDTRAVEKLIGKSAAAPLGGYRDNLALVGIVSTQLWHREFVAEAAGQPVAAGAVA